MWGEAPLHGQRLCKQMAPGDRGCLLPAAGLEGDTALAPSLPFCSPPQAPSLTWGVKTKPQPVARV